VCCCRIKQQQHPHRTNKNGLTLLLCSFFFERRRRKGGGGGNITPAPLHVRRPSKTSPATVCLCVYAWKMNILYKNFDNCFFFFFILSIPFCDIFIPVRCCCNNSYIMYTVCVCFVLCHVPYTTTEPDESGRPRNCTQQQQSCRVLSSSELCQVYLARERERESDRQRQKELSIFLLFAIVSVSLCLTAIWSHPSNRKCN
jgi:hypothetical protein